MPRHQRVKSKSGYYHIMIRGNERKNIFHDEADKLKFMEKLNQKKQGNRFFLHAFCLMDNHVHLMISEGEEDVAKVMKRITVSYVSYFNKKYKRVGHLFQDRYKSEIVDEDSYVLALARYIHQNPVKAGMVKSVEEYKWSSYHHYVNGWSDIVDTDIGLGLFSPNKENAHRQFIVYMNEKAQESFIDLVEEIDVMEEDAAKLLYGTMLLSEEGVVSEKLIKEFRHKTRLPIRKIAEITGLNKDKVNKFIKA